MTLDFANRIITQVFKCKCNNYILPLPLFIGKPFLIPIGILHLGGGDFGLSTSIRSVHPVVNCPLLKYPLYISVLKLELVNSGPKVNHPGRMVLSRPNKCNLKYKYEELNLYKH